MNIKHVTTAFILASAIFTQATFAADTQPEKPDGAVTAAAAEQMPPQFARRQAHMKFFKDFKENEAALLQDLAGLDRKEAEARLTDFYTQVFKAIPERNSRFTSRVTAMISDMDIPDEVKEQVLDKIEDDPAAQTQQMQEEVINFAKSLLDLPAEKRENAIAGYNRYVARYIIGNGGKKHNMNKGPKHMGMMGMGRMDKGMGDNKENCPAANFNGMPMMPMRGHGMRNQSFSAMPPKQQMNPEEGMNNPGYMCMQPKPEGHGPMRGFSGNMQRPGFMGKQCPQPMNMRNCPFFNMGMQPKPQMMRRGPEGFPPAMRPQDFNGNTGPRCPKGMPMMQPNTPMPCPMFSNMPMNPMQMNNMPGNPNRPDQFSMGMPGRHHGKSMNEFNRKDCRQNFHDMPPFMKKRFMNPDPRFRYGPQAPEGGAPEDMMQMPPRNPQDGEQIPEDQPIPQPENE